MHKRRKDMQKIRENMPNKESEMLGEGEEMFKDFWDMQKGGRM